MNARFTLVIIGLCGSIALSATAATAGSNPQAPAAANDTAAGNPYATLISRNVFGLVPIPVVDPESLKPAPEPPVKITPNGIMTLFGKLQVLFKVQQPAAGGKPAKDISYTMAEGERQDDIEVQKINEQAATITFNNHGVVQTLELAKAASVAPPAAAPAGRPAPGMIPRPAGSPAMARHVPGGAAAMIAAGRAGGGRDAGSGNPSAGGAPGLGGNVNSGGNAAAQQPQITPEEQVLMIEAQRLNYIQQGDDTAMILPITELTSEVLGEEPGTPGQGGPNPNSPGQ